MKRIKIEETDSWQKPIISISNNGTATKGYRYIVGASPTGEFSGLTTNSIVIFDGTAWLEDIPETGWMTYDINQDLLLIYEDSSWSAYINGIPAGGTTGQVLKKIDGTDYNTEWDDVGGGGALDDLTDVDTTGVTDGQALVYDSGTSKWIPGTLGVIAALTIINFMELQLQEVTALSNLSTVVTLGAS